MRGKQQFGTFGEEKWENRTQEAGTFIFHKRMFAVSAASLLVSFYRYRYVETSKIQPEKKGKPSSVLEM